MATSTALGCLCEWGESQPFITADEILLIVTSEITAKTIGNFEQARWA